MRILKSIIIDLSSVMYEKADIDEQVSIESENVELKEKKNNKVGLITIATVVISFIILSYII